MRSSRYPTVFLTERGLRHQQAALAAAPPELEVVMLRRPTRAGLWPHLATAVFLISERAGVIDADMIAAASHLRLILRLGSFTHDIDLEAARRAGVVVSTWPVRGAVMVSEHLVLQMLALAKRLRQTEAAVLAERDWGAPKRTDEDTFAYNWTGQQGIGGLWQKTVGILGLGEIGAELARRLAGWDCTLYYHRRRRLPGEVEARLGLAYRSRDALLATSDFVVNVLPYSAETDLSLDEAVFSQMKVGACLVSAGSGSVIDEAALAAALVTHRLAGAAIDTYEWEPLPIDNPLRALAVREPRLNVLLTPHVGAGTLSAAADPAGQPAWRAEEYTPVIDFLRGAPLRYRVA